LETFHLKNYCLMLTFGNDRDVIPWTSEPKHELEH
jgi:hypothetical protein